MNRFFNIGKVGCFVDGYAPGVEKRRGGDVSVLTVKLRIQPFDSKLAHALDDGAGGDTNVRRTVFSLNSGDPLPLFTRHDFKVPIDRQNLTLFSSPDTDVARVALTQAKISGCYVRSQKDVNGLALCFKATFGPVDRDQLELIHSLHRLQTFITFEEAEPLIEAEADGGRDNELTEADEKARQVLSRPPMWTEHAAVPADLSGLPATAPGTAGDAPDAAAEPARILPRRNKKVH